jgi:tRNA (guanine-N7-)-methyltransferase
VAQKKLIRFAEIETFPNVLQHPQNVAGTWNKFFINNNLIVLELACGKGEYTLGLSHLYPDKNFIGVDIKGNRLWVGAKKALQQKLENVAFLRIQIDEINEYFGSGEVSEIWITFPDPQLRISKSKKRLTHPKFLRLYQQILSADGRIHLKTDSPELYNFTKQVIELYKCILHTDIDDVQTQKDIHPALEITTHYESLNISQSNKVHYLSFSLPRILPGIEMDKLLHAKFKEQNAATDVINMESGITRDDEEDLYYFNDSGLIIFTEEYLLNRGYCCGSGCTNCPYDYKAVPEPQRTILLTKRKNAKEKNSQ